MPAVGVMEELEETVSSTKKKPVYLTAFQRFLDKKPKKVAILTHSGPDPDAIGSMMGLQWLLEKFDIAADLLYHGQISHPQNLAFVNLLSPDLKSLEENEQTSYDARILVDTVPSNARYTKGPFDMVIDHHKEMLNGDFKGVFIHLKAGSCCGVVHSLIEGLGHSFKHDNDLDSLVATALIVGVMTDTEDLMSDDTTIEYDFHTCSQLFQYRDPISLKQILHYQRPKLWTEKKADAAKLAIIEDGVAVVGLGILHPKHRDMIADMSSEMVTWEDVKTAVVFALVDEKIEGSVRSSNASISVHSLCKELGGCKHGNGGGKLGKGAYYYNIAGGGVDEDDDDATKQKIWDHYAHKETKRIFKIIKK